MTTRPCIEADCPNLTDDGPRCADHAHLNRTGSTRRWRRIRRRALRRDDWTCTGCGKNGRPLEVDHIDGDPSNDRLDNLRTLCDDCHRDRHRVS